MTFSIGSNGLGREGPYPATKKNSVGTFHEDLSAKAFLDMMGAWRRRRFDYAALFAHRLGTIDPSELHVPRGTVGIPIM